MPDLDPTTWLVLLGAALVVAVLSAVLLTVWLGRIWRSIVARGRVRQGHRAESEAERLLERAGYRVEARQVTGRWELLVDGQPQPVTCRADLIVRRRRKRFIAEVKSGDHGARPTAPGTRRQLLEYARAFDVDGVLLVDMVRRRIYVVRFPETG